MIEEASKEEWGKNAKYTAADLQIVGKFIVFDSLYCKYFLYFISVIKR